MREGATIRSLGYGGLSSTWVYYILRSCATIIGLSSPPSAPKQHLVHLSQELITNPCILNSTGTRPTSADSNLQYMDRRRNNTGFVSKLQGTSISTSSLLLNVPEHHMLGQVKARCMCRQCVRDIRRARVTSNRRLTMKTVVGSSHERWRCSLSEEAHFLFTVFSMVTRS
jgi:hypothetical protein